jgi:hypothetical protein
LKVAFFRALQDVVAQLRHMRVDAVPFGEEGGDHAIYDLKRPTPSGYDVHATLHVTDGRRGRVRLEMEFQAKRQTFRHLTVETGGGQGFVATGGNGFAAVFLGQHRGHLIELCRYRGALSLDGTFVRLDAQLPGRSDLRRTVAAMVQLWRALRPNGAMEDGGPRRAPPSPPPQRSRPRNDTPASEEADRLLGWINDATTPWSSTCERVRETIEARVQLELQVGEPLSGRVVLAFASVGRRLDKLGLRATLDVPPLGGKLKLTPQKGFGGFLSRWGEDVLDDDPIDDAYVIKLGGYPKQWLLAHRRELLALAPWGATVQQATEHLVLNLDHLGTKPDEVQPAVIATLKLWERWVEQVVGA